MKHFETGFDAPLSRFNSHGAEEIPEALVALMLLFNGDVEDKKRVAIHPASVRSVSRKEYRSADDM